MTATTVSPTTASPATASPTPFSATTVRPATTARVEVHDGAGWFALCDLADLAHGRGVAALLPDGTQAAVFLDRTGRTYAIGNRDPFTGAYVLSRGLLGSADGAPFVASPLLKQRFDLATGRCLDDPAVSVPVFNCRATPPPPPRPGR